MYESDRSYIDRPTFGISSLSIDQLLEAFGLRSDSHMELFRTESVGLTDVQPGVRYITQIYKQRTKHVV